MNDVDGVRGCLEAGEIKYLTRLVGEYRDPVIAEIGSLYGLSAITMAKANPRSTIYCHDTWADPPCDKYALMTFRRNAYKSGCQAAIVEVQGDSSASAALYPDDHFDIVFVDGDHSTDGCFADMRAWWPKCKGTMIGHDREHPGVRGALLRFVRETGLTICSVDGTGGIWEVLR